MPARCQTLASGQSQKENPQTTCLLVLHDLVTDAAGPYHVAGDEWGVDRQGHGIAGQRNQGSAESASLGVSAGGRGGENWNSNNDDALAGINCRRKCLGHIGGSGEVNNPSDHRLNSSGAQQIGGGLFRSHSV